MKATISKQMAEGELWVFEIDAKDPEQLRDRLTHSMPFLEGRLQEMGTRVVEAHKWVLDLPPEVRQAVHSVLGILFGKQGATEQLMGAKEVIDRNARDLARLKETYEPDVESAKPTPPPVELSAADVAALGTALEEVDHAAA